MSPDDIHRTIDAVWRIESPRVIAAAARIVRGVGLAEELARTRSSQPSSSGPGITCSRHAATCWIVSDGARTHRAEFERAAALTRNGRERGVLLAREAGCTREVGTAHG